jgi:AcrR family transcriptional regulator
LEVSDNLQRVTVAATRQTAEERRETVLEAATVEFAKKGLHGGSTDAIARAAGISQPYLFRLFGSKKELYRATIARCMRRTLETFQRSAEGLRGAEALEAMGMAYVNELLPDRIMLLGQMQAYAACDDPEIRDAVRQGYGDLVAYVERVSGLPPVEVSKFFAQGMLLNVIAAMGLDTFEEPWAARLMEGCKEIDE